MEIDHVVNSESRPASARSKKVAGTLLTRIVALALGGAGTVVAARALGPAQQGTYQLLVSVGITSMVLCHFSIEQANAYLWHRGSSRSMLATNSAVLGLVNGALAGSVAWVVIGLLRVGSFSAVDRHDLVIVLLAIPGAMTSLYLAGLTTLDDRIGRVNAARVLAVGGQLALLLILVRGRGITVPTALAVWAAISVFPCLILAPRLGIRLRAFSWSETRDAIGLGLRYHLGMVAVFLLWRVDMFILNAYSARRQVGLYAIAVPIAELLYLLTDTVSLVFMPQQLEDSATDAALLTTRLFRLNMLLGGLGVVCLAIFSPLLITTVFGASYSGSVPPLIAILPGVASLGLVRPVQVMLLRLNRPYRVSLLYIAAFLLNVGLNILLIPQLGAVGASLSSTVAYLFLALFLASWFARAYRVDIRQLFPRFDDISHFIREGKSVVVGFVRSP